MPRVVAKLGPGQYIVWSTVVDAPVSYVYDSFDDAARDWADDSPAWGRRSDSDIAWMNTTGRKNCEAGGCSVSRWTLKDLLACNRAGKDETEMTLDEILSAYSGERPGSGQSGAEIAKNQAPTSSPDDEAPQNQSLGGASTDKDE